MSLMLPKNHFFLNQAVNINEICNPLKKFGITIFTYLKKFKDGSHINLSSNGRWVEDYYTLNLYQSSLFEKHPKFYQSGFSLWPCFSNLEVFIHGRDYFDSHYGITAIKQQDDGCEFYFFSGSAKTPWLIDFYLNNLDILERFIIYFKTKANKILELAKKSTIILPTHTENNKLTSEETKLYDFYNKLDDLRKEFTTETKLTRYRITNGTLKNVVLSNRELDCLTGLFLGKTAKEIAAQLLISKRTAEKHIANIKNKCGCSHRSQLVEQFLTSNNIKLFNWPIEIKK